MNEEVKPADSTGSSRVPETGSNGAKRTSGDETLDLSVLTPEQRELLRELQANYDAGVEEVSDEFAARLERDLKWNLDDPKSVAQMSVFAAHDPYLRREVRQIQRDFARADLAALEQGDE